MYFECAFPSGLQNSILKHEVHLESVQLHSDICESLSVLFYLKSFFMNLASVDSKDQYKSVLLQK